MRCYDYVNHPYDAVREALGGDTVGVFRDATRAASERSKSLESELSVNIGGVQVGTEVTIQVHQVLERPAHGKTPPMTVIDLEWAATNLPGLFPLMQAQLLVYPLTSTETQLELSGTYDVPLGVLGGAVDALVGHRVAEASVDRFIKHVAGHLRQSLSETPRPNT